MKIERRAIAAALVLAVGGAPAAVAEEAAALRHTVQRGDTLSELAQRYLDDPAQWRALSAANGHPPERALPPGLVLEIPDALRRAKPGGATVAHVSGEVRLRRADGSEVPLARGARLIDGEGVRTGRNGFATLTLADDSVVRIAGDSLLRLDRVAYIVRARRADTRIGLEQGRIESAVRPLRETGSRFSVDTPLMAAGVRGTEFGVTVLADGASASDVHSGTVAVAARATTGSAEALTAGLGAGIRPGEALTAPFPLPQAPELAAMPQRIERPLVELPFPPVAGAAGYRFYLERDRAASGEVIDNGVFGAPPLRLDGLPDGAYRVRVSAFDRHGAEGRAAAHAFVLKARPEPPVTLAPEQDGIVESANVAFGWAQPGEARGYELQWGRDPAFGAGTRTVRLDRQDQSMAEGLASGVYHWRIRSIAEADGQPDPGPYGDVRRFSVRLPADGGTQVSQQGRSLTLRWDGEPGQRYVVQVARDAGFGALVAQYEVDSRSLSLDGLESGSYYVRRQAIDADGFRRAFSSPQAFRVRNFVQSDGAGFLRAGDGQEIQLQ